MENTNLTVINSLLKALRTVCEENDLHYILAVEAKNKPDSALWFRYPTDSDLNKAEQIIANYLYHND